MYTLPKEWLKFLREQHPPGSRIRLTEMKDPYRSMAPGTMGTLDRIDDIGTYHVHWDDGSGLGLVIGEDRFTVLPPELTTMKLYMPLNGDLYEQDDYGDMEDEPNCIGGCGLRIYADAIASALVKNQMPEEAERGIMHWYDEPDTVNNKVQSAVFKVEERDGRLWGVAECKVYGELQPKELETLKDYIEGQASDGWGESFEQREIQTDDGELYVHLWDSDDWNIQTEQERFSPKLAEGLPEMCFSTLKTTGELICIKRGESGYYPSTWSSTNKEENVEKADQLNEELGVTPEQRQAMEIGSMAGWNVPGADPANYGGAEHRFGGGMTLG